MNVRPIAICDICHQPILENESKTDDGDEVAHITCVREWFRRQFGRETLA